MRIEAAVVNASPLISLRSAGLWLSDDLIELLKKQAEE